MLGIKKCFLCRQKLESNYSEAEGSLIRPHNNPRFLYKKNDKLFHVCVDIRKDILEESVD